MAVLAHHKTAPARRNATQKIPRAKVAISDPQIVRFHAGQHLPQQRPFLGVPVFTQDDLGGQHALLIQHHQNLAGQRRRPRVAQCLKAMCTRGEMIPIEDLRPVPGHQRGQLRLQRPNHWGRLPRRIPDQLGRHPPLHLAPFVIHGLVRDAELCRLRLIGGMHAGLDSQHHLSHQIHHRRKQQRTRILHLGSACT